MSERLWRIEWQLVQGGQWQTVTWRDVGYRASAELPANFPNKQAALESAQNLGRSRVRLVQPSLRTSVPIPVVAKPVPVVASRPVTSSRPERSAQDVGWLNSLGALGVWVGSWLAGQPARSSRSRVGITRHVVAGMDGGSGDGSATAGKA
jgi:hypothetical protein